MAKFDGERFKTQLKLAKFRLENLLKQHRNTSGGRRREIATLLQTGHEDRARVNVKYLIRDDYLMEAYEMLVTCCDDLIMSTGLIAREKELDADLVMPAKSLLFAAGRIDAPELDRIKEQFEAKYGRAFVDVNSDVGKTTVDPSLVVKLSIRQPDPKLVDRYLAAIAQIFNVNWQAPEAFVDDAPAGTAAVPGHAAGSGSAALSSPPTNIIMSPPAPAIDYNAPPPPYSSSPGTAPPANVPPAPAPVPPSSVPDFEELQRRFQALKENKR